MQIDEFKEQFNGLNGGEYSINHLQGSADPTYGIKAVVCTYEKDKFERELQELLAKYSL